MKDVVIYSKPHCPNCEEAKKVLTSRNIIYKIVDVSLDLEALNILKLGGFRSVPQIYVGGVHLGDHTIAKMLEV